MGIFCLIWGFGAYIVIGGVETTGDCDMILIDKGMDISKCDNSTRKTGLYLTAISGTTFDEYTIRNCFGVYMDGVTGCTFPLLDLTDVYGFYPRNCNYNHFKIIKINRSWVGAKLMEFCANNTFDEIYSDYANDRDPSLTAPNGDGVTINFDTCSDNKFGIIRANNNTDCGLDNKGTRVFIHDFEGHGNLHGSKQWGESNVIDRYWAIGNKANGVLCIAGSTTIKNANLRENGAENVKMALGGTSYTKSLIISGFVDKMTVNVDSVAKLTNNLKVGVPTTTPPAEDYKKMYTDLLVQYDEMRAKLEAALKSADALQAKIDKAKVDLS